MNLMFRKNFAPDKGPSSGERTSGVTGGGPGLGGGGGGVGSGGTRLGRGGVVGTGRGPIRRSREFGYYPMDHDHSSYSYRTHLFLSPPAGGAGQGPDEPAERLGPGPRRNSGPHVIKWGGGPGTNQNKRKSSAIQKDINEPPTPTASRQVKLIFYFLANFQISHLLFKGM